MADHREEASVDVALLAAPDLVDGGAHIVVNPPARHAAQHAKGVIMGVEQHLVGLQQIGPHDEGATVAEFEVRYLELGTDPGNADRKSVVEGKSLSVRFDLGGRRVIKKK